jgi:glycosyltransferase involved in cell wall biosynthesis
MHIVYCIAPGGGPEAYIQNILPWLENRGHHISIIYTVRPREQHPFPSHVRVLYAPPGDLHYYLARIIGHFRGWTRYLRTFEHSQILYRTIDRIASVEPVDIVEVVEGVSVRGLSRRWHVVIRGHGSDWTFRYFCQDGFRQYDHKFAQLEANQLRQVDAVSTISAHLADHLSEFCHYPRERIHAIPYSLDLVHFAPSEGYHSSRDLAVMAVGRLERRKGTDLLLKAMRTVWQRFPATKVYLLGSEAEFTRQELLEMVPQDKRDRLIFPGFVSRERLPDYYRDVTVYVTPTQYETFGYTILEAMACGLPIITCQVGAIPELVDNNLNGLLVPPNDVEILAASIQRLLGSPELVKSMGKAAREKALLYAPERVNPLLEQLYNNTLRGN